MTSYNVNNIIGTIIPPERISGQAGSLALSLPRGLQINLFSVPPTLFTYISILVATPLWSPHHHHHFLGYLEHVSAAAAAVDVTASPSPADVVVVELKSGKMFKSINQL